MILRMLHNRGRSSFGFVFTNPCPFKHIRHTLGAACCSIIFLGDQGLCDIIQNGGTEKTMAHTAGETLDFHCR